MRSIHLAAQQSGIISRADDPVLWILPDSRRLFLQIIEHLRLGGAQGIVLGCTEIPLLVRPQDCALPLFNTTILHAEKALNFAVQPIQQG